MPEFRSLFPLLLALHVVFLAVPARAGRLSPVRLRCEYRENPLGIEEAAPRLSWQLLGRGRGLKQTAYEVLAASRPGLLAPGRADLWDSGRVSSDQSVHVPYRGKRLASGQRAYWTVRVWGHSGAPAVAKSAWWEMGLLEPGDWTAAWIGLPAPQAVETLGLEGARWVWYPEGSPQQSAPVAPRFFRRVIELPAGRRVTRATLMLAVDDEATVFVNGKEAGTAAGWQAAGRIDLTEALAPGRNVLAIRAMNQQGPAGLLGRLRIETEGGPAQTVELDASWKARDREEPGWNTAAFDDASWPASRPFAPAGAPPWGGPPKLSPEPGPATYVRREVTLDRPIHSARAYVSALGVYELRINGRRVGDHLLAPGWTDYRKRVMYQTYDVTPLLRRGLNAVGAIVGDGWYCGALGWGLQRDNFGPSPPRVRVQLNVRYADGSTATIATGDGWEASTGPILQSDLYAGETYDARKELTGWDRPDFRPQAHWNSPRVYTDTRPVMNAQGDPPIRVTEELPTRGITQPKPGVYVFDLGQNMVGFARLRVRGSAGTRVTLRFAEVLNPGGTVYRENLRNARATDVYVLRGGGTETFEPHFTYHGFRYVEVTGFPGAPKPDALTGLVFHSSMPFTSRLQTSSELVNRLFRNILWGQRANLMSVPTDCPQRDERLGWMGDAQLFARTASWNMDMAAFWTKWTSDILDAQSPAGAFSDVSPRVVDMADGAPAWAEAGLVVPWTIYQCYGDLRILERSYDAMRKYGDLLVEANPDLLWLKRRNNDFGDWVPAGEQTNKDLIACAYLAYDLRLLSETARALGKTADAERYAGLAARSRDAYNARFLGADDRYTGDTQTAYAMSLAFGLVPEARREGVGKRLAEAIQRRRGTLSTGFIGTALLLPALSEIGRDDLAYQILQNTRYPSWGYMIERGATTIWELWDSDRQGPAMNSRNHFAFGSVGEWMQRYLAGIDLDPQAPGYRRIVIHPHPGGELRQARGEYDSIYGTIASEWRRDEGGATLHVTVPANTTATVVVPGAGDRLVREGSRTVWRGGKFLPGTRGVSAGERTPAGVRFEVGSGDYVFTVSSK